uniref:Uncharacterized protein n=1 Tax=Pyramimonas obovata TaxID=1411642 RepID=A0A7S0QWQ0_9CHLO|mmetsp:Transcript_14648/g.31393  ORF Transcript_14648/g.31393 Transcript_14648/m.31393 type:complete len:202 (+) Transcript_14648:266-871(+)
MPDRELYVEGALEEGRGINWFSGKEEQKENLHGDMRFSVDKIRDAVLRKIYTDEDQDIDVYAEKNRLKQIKAMKNRDKAAVHRQYHNRDKKPHRGPSEPKPSAAKVNALKGMMHKERSKMLGLLEAKIELADLSTELEQMVETVDDIHQEHDHIAAQLEIDKGISKKKRFNALCQIVSWATVGVGALIYLYVLKVQSMEGW